MLKKSITFFIITSAALMIIASLTLFTKAAPQPTNTSEELQAQKQLIISYIESANLVSAQAEFDNLIADFGDTEEIVHAVYDIAEKYRHTQNFQTSIDTYKYILDNHPDSERAIWAQTFTAVDYVALSYMQNAQAETEKLLQQYDGDPNLAAAVTEIGGAYHWFKNYPQADAINELVLERWPDSQPALWAGMNLITSKLAMGELAEASAGIEQFLIKHSGDERLPEALFYIAGSYEYSKRYDEAKSVLQMIAEQFPESNPSANVPFAFARIDVLSAIDSNEPNSLQAVDDFAAEFSGWVDLPGTLVHTIAYQIYNKAFEIGSDGLEFESKAYFQKVADIWELVSATHPELTQTLDGYNWAGTCYRMIGQHDKTVDCYENLVEKFPDYDLSWNALFLLGRSYEKMQKSGDITESEAKPKITAAYQQLIEEYPTCDAAKAANHWLNQNNLN